MFLYLKENIFCLFTLHSLLLTHAMFTRLYVVEYKFNNMEHVNTAF